MGEWADYWWDEKPDLPMLPVSLARQLPDPNVGRWMQQVRDAIATAWDEGYLRGVLDQESELDQADNPYRLALDPQPADAPDGGR